MVVSTLIGAGVNALAQEALENKRRKTAKEQMALEDKWHNEEMAWQRENFATQMDFANRQLGEQTRIADQNFALQQQSQSWNQNMQQSAFDYQKQLNATQMQREDTALQRQMADARAAGLSPLSVVGSSGASSSPLSSSSPSDVNAAQYDGSGIASASGQYLDLANQYAQLHMMATNQHLSRRQQAYQQERSLQQGAQLALAQMVQNMTQNQQSLALQVFNSAVNARNSFAQRDLWDASASRTRAETEWNDLNGWRSQSLENLAVSLLASFLRGSSVSSNTVDSIKSSIKDFFAGNGERTVKADVPKSEVVVTPFKTLPTNLKKSVSNLLNGSWDKGDARYVYANFSSLQNKYSFDEWMNFRSKDKKLIRSLFP